MTARRLEFFKFMKEKIIRRIYELETKLANITTYEMACSIKNELDFLRDLILSE